MEGDGLVKYFNIFTSQQSTRNETSPWVSLPSVKKYDSYLVHGDPDLSRGVPLSEGDRVRLLNTINGSDSHAAQRGQQYCGSRIRSFVSRIQS